MSAVSNYAGAYIPIPAKNRLISRSVSDFTGRHNARFAATADIIGASLLGVVKNPGRSRRTCSSSTKPSRSGNGARSERRRVRTCTMGKGDGGPKEASEIGRAHLTTPVTNAQLACRLLFEKNNRSKRQH